MKISQFEVCWKATTASTEVLIFILYIDGNQISQYLPGDPLLSAFLLLAWTILIVGYHIAFVILPRLRDFGLPALAVLLCFVPLLNTVLALGLFFGPRNYWQRLRSQVS